MDKLQKRFFQLQREKRNIFLEAGCSPIVHVKRLFSLSFRGADGIRQPLLEQSTWETEIRVSHFDIVQK